MKKEMRQIGDANIGAGFSDLVGNSAFQVSRANVKALYEDPDSPKRSPRPVEDADSGPSSKSKWEMLINFIRPS